MVSDMAEPIDPHELDLADIFPTLAAERREEMREFLDRYCEIAYRVFERIEVAHRLGLDPPEESS